MSNKDNPVTSWIKQQLTLAAVVLVALQLLPAFVVLLKSLLVTLTVAVLIVLAVRGFAGYLTGRRQRW